MAARARGVSAAPPTCRGRESVGSDSDFGCLSRRVLPYDTVSHVVYGEGPHCATRTPMRPPMHTR
eukprot:6186374-Prymnesium_polylepis.1